MASKEFLKEMIKLSDSVTPNKDEPYIPVHLWGCINDIDTLIQERAMKGYKSLSITNPALDDIVPIIFLEEVIDHYNKCGFKVIHKLNGFFSRKYEEIEIHWITKPND